MAIEEPRFKVLEQDGSFELREYSPYIVAETRVEAGFEDAGNAYLVAFTLPSSYTLATAPQPLDPTVQIREVPAQLIACWRYSGRWTASNYRDHEALLRERIKARGLIAAGDPVLARYNAPFTPWFMRRNEVLIALAPQPKR